MNPDKNYNINLYWRGKNLKETTEHIVNYVKTKDEEYFTKHLYERFLVLGNYIYHEHIVPKNPYLPEHKMTYDDAIGEAWRFLIPSFDKYNPELNAFSYFFCVMSRAMVQASTCLYLGKRDFRAEYYIDAEEYDGENTPSWHETTECDGPSESDKIEEFKQRLKLYINYTKEENYTKYGKQLRQLCRDLIDGKIKLPESLDGQKQIGQFLRSYVSGSGPTVLRQRRRLTAAIHNFERSKLPPEMRGNNMSETKVKRYYPKLPAELRKGLCDGLPTDPILRKTEYRKRYQAKLKQYKIDSGLLKRNRTKVDTTGLLDNLPTDYASRKREYQRRYERRKRALKKKAIFNPEETMYSHEQQ